MSSLSISAALGFCGVIYELVFAQSLSALFGQTVTQYSIAIGLFLAGMGLGSRAAEAWTDPRLCLWRIQLLVSLLAPLLLVSVWWLAVGGWPLTARFLAYAMCFIVGALTGAELPLLMRFQSSGLILGADCFGMLAACLLFPLALLPSIGVFAALFVTALLNSLVMMMLRFDRRALGAPLLLIAALIFEPGLREWLSQKLIAG